MKIEIENKYKHIFEKILEMLSDNIVIKIDDLKKEILASCASNEEIIDDIIYYLLSKDCLEINDNAKKFGLIRIKLIEKPEIRLIEHQVKQEHPKIVMTLPPYNIFGLKTDLRSQNFPIITLKEEFFKLFEKANHSIYICSPFLEYSGFETFLPLLLTKAKNGVVIKVIARQINLRDPYSRYDQIKKIQKIFLRNNANIHIRNYHFLKENCVVSSTHAKMIVCDYEYAYVGSGELRKSSFEKNFELGVILRGEGAYQLGVIFDRLFSVSSDFLMEDDKDGTMV